MKKSELLEMLAKYEAALDLLDYKSRQSDYLNIEDVNEVLVVADLPTILKSEG
jgi:hypothetical protein